MRGLRASLVAAGIATSFLVLVPTGQAPMPGYWDCPPGIHDWPVDLDRDWYPEQCANCWTDLGGQWNLNCGEGLDCQPYFNEATCGSCWDASGNDPGTGWHGPGWTCDIPQDGVSCEAVAVATLDCDEWSDRFDGSCWDGTLPGWLCEPPPQQG